MAFFGLKLQSRFSRDFRNREIVTFFKLRQISSHFIRDVKVFSLLKKYTFDKVVHLCLVYKPIAIF